MAPRGRSVCITPAVGAARRSAARADQVFTGCSGKKLDIVIILLGAWRLPIFQSQGREYGGGGILNADKVGISIGAKHRGRIHASSIADLAAYTSLLCAVNTVMAKSWFRHFVLVSISAYGIYYGILKSRIEGWTSSNSCSAPSFETVIVAVDPLVVYLKGFITEAERQYLLDTRLVAFYPVTLGLYVHISNHAPAVGDLKKQISAEVTTMTSPTRASAMQGSSILVMKTR